MASNPRPAFTLIELLVVMALILVLASLSVMFVPRMSEQQRAARGASLLQQWLITAQQQALRDRTPQGVRFFLDYQAQLDDIAASTTPIRLHGLEGQYIGVPDDYRDVQLSVFNATLVTFANPSFTNGSGTTADWSIQPGDYLELFGTGAVHRIIDVRPTSGVPGQYEVELASALPFNGGVQTNDYRIIRQPRITSDELLKLPDEIIIDFTPKSTFDTAFAFNTLPHPTDATKPDINESVDILFSPSGGIIGKQMGPASLAFWVRDVTMNLDEGEPSLIAVYSRTGAIEAHPVDISGYVPGSTPPFPSPADPYSFTRDGRSSGN